MTAPALLLVNLGTPRSTDVEDVRAFLREFLGDEKVIGGPAPLRRALVDGLIAPRRGPRSARAYARVWTPEGSPILAHGRRLAAKVQERLPQRRVLLAMRYGEPGLAPALDELVREGHRRVTVLPLFPQYADSTTGSAAARVAELAAGRLAVDLIPDFFDHEGFIGPAARPIAELIERVRPDRVLLSYHGVPESHLVREDASGSHCLWSASCCARIEAVNRRCYRAQCVATSRALADRLGLAPDRVVTGFQSRFGPTRWTRPYTDGIVEELAGSGVKRVVAASPAFAADCLETIEEIGMTERARFIEHGGEDLWRARCVNDADDWADGLVRIVADHESGRLPLVALG